jgi:hypothetical protein
VLLGPDAASLRISDAEAMLLHCLRGLKIEPHDAMTALVTAGAGTTPAPPDQPRPSATDLATALRPLLTHPDPA